MSYGDDLNDVLADSRRKALEEGSDLFGGTGRRLSEAEIEEAVRAEAEAEAGRREAMSDDELFGRWKRYAEMETAGKGLFYIPSRTMEIFHADTKMFRFIMGPVGSGKTTGIVADAQIRCMGQNPCADGVIRNRGAFIRGTHRELRETLVDTWMHMFPTTTVRLSHPLSGEYRCPGPNGELCVTEFRGYGMDKPGAESDMRSNAFSFAIMNECQYLGYHIVRLLRERVGRYPSKSLAPRNWKSLDAKWWWPGTDDVGGEWRWFRNLGVNGDTNAPPEDHWWVYRSEKEPIPDLLSFHKQPPAMFRTWDAEREKFVYTPNTGQKPGVLPAENIENLSEGWEYYIDLVRMNGDEYAARNVLNEYGSSATGTPVFSEFNCRWHVPKFGVKRPERGQRIVGGMDFGRTPRVVLGYVDARGRVCCFAEIKRDCGIQMFAERVLRPFVVSMGINPWEIRLFCDPASMQFGEQSERTSIQIMRECGFSNAVAPNLINNSVPMRIETVRQFLNRIVGETGGLVFDPTCEECIITLSGGYVWKRVKRGAEYVDLDKPDDRSIYSHMADAIQYLCVGVKYGGVDAEVTPVQNKSTPGLGIFDNYVQNQPNLNGWVV